MTKLATRVRSISFRTRVGALVTLAVGATVALAALLSYIAVSHQLLSQVDSSLVGDVANAPRLNALGQINYIQLGTFLAANGDTVFQVTEPNGNVVLTSAPGGVPFPVSSSQAALALTQRHYGIVSTTFHGVPYRVITEGGYSGLPLAVQIARPLTDIYHSLSELRFILWLVTLGGVALAIALGYAVGKTTLRPVERLTAAAEHVAATQDLESTLEETGDDELTRLAHAFNSMLAALAASRQQQAQLISDAGHELRTPMTSLRTNIEVLMRVPDLPDADREELVADVQAQLEELSTLVGDVVDLARTEETHAEPLEFRLDAIVARAVERARRRAPAVKFETRLTPGSVIAQPPLLERAILNVLDNAAKWSPPGGVVTVWLQRADRWTLDIRDQGPGISAEDLPHVFDRFYRAQSARSMPGSGLGLAIVRQVVVDHGGSVSAEAPAGAGTLIHIELPTVAEDEVEDPHQNGASTSEWAPPSPPDEQSATPDAGAQPDSVWADR